MFKQIFSALKSGDTLDEAFSKFETMLEHSQWMFESANKVLVREVDPQEVRDAIFSRDQSVNGLLKSIRRKIVRHLTINPGLDVAASLALMSVAKDAERIGDYCKNVFEVGQFYTEDFHVSKYHEPLRQVRGDVEKLFTTVRGAWRESDTRAAHEAIAIADMVGNKCDGIVEQLLGDRAQMKVHEAVAYSLLARHYKRVSSHLANISTAILGRIEDLDFRG